MRAGMYEHKGDKASRTERGFQGSAALTQQRFHVKRRDDLDNDNSCLVLFVASALKHERSKQPFSPSPGAQRACPWAGEGAAQCLLVHEGPW